MISRAYRPSISILIAFVSSHANAEAWKTDSDPYLIDPRFASRLEDLPLRAELAESARPWSAPFWADRKGSIAYRWQTGEKPWTYLSPSLEALRKMRREEIARLSAAEKIDIARGRYDYPTVALVRGYAKPSDPHWKGACAGWSQSALNFERPVPHDYMNPDGIEVSFGAGDLEALAAFYYDFVAVSDDPASLHDDRVTGQLGRKCHAHDPRANCARDVNPGALHILLANRLGRDGRGIIADFGKRVQVWQHPIYGYAAEIRGERPAEKSAAPTAIRQVRVHLDLRFTKYGPATWEGATTKVGSRDVEYWLDLDGDGRIVGGRYVSILPGKILDYVWTSESIHFERGYEILNEMLTPKKSSSTFTEPFELRTGR